MTEKKNEYCYETINKGKPFTLPNWNVIKHKKVLQKMTSFEESEDGKKSSKYELDDRYQNFLILEGLKDIDPDVNDKILDEMHPNDKSALFAAIYYQGAEGVLYRPKKKGDDANFQQKNQK
jgi:hypothetical protein